MTTGYVCLMSK